MAAAAGGGGRGGGSGSSPSGSSATPAAAAAAELHPLAGKAITATFGAIAASVVVGAIGYSTGNQRLFRQMYRARMVLAATALGLYAGAAFPPPRLLETVVGRPPSSSRPPS